MVKRDQDIQQVRLSGNYPKMSSFDNFFFLDLIGANTDA
jgi:hypothetical protein